MTSNLDGALGRNLLLRSDSYKVSHWVQYPPGTRTVFSYVESRGGAFGHGVFFGLQAWLREYLSRPVTQADVDEAQALMALHGLPFNRAGWQLLIDRHGGRLPLRIRAVPEGSVLPVRNVLATVENTDPDFFWLTSYIETELLRAIWYPSTVATVSAAAKATLLRYLRANSDDPEGQIGFKLHDFGARGVSSNESAALGGLAHLVNFQGTDTLMALMAARRWYDCEIAGFSIPAAEHSTITSWGRAHEADAYRNMLAQFARPGATFAVVSDSYDIFRACDELWGRELKAEVQRSGATLVVRPDSGEPAPTVLKVAQILAERFGTRTNARGFKVLNTVRIIQGDGIDLDSLRTVLATLHAEGFAAENIAFGMGGGLLQRCNRDTMQWAMKCSAVQVGDEWREVFKDPVGDTRKRSKRGRLTLAGSAEAGWRTARLDGPEGAPADDALQTVYENGELLRTQSFDEVRGLAAAGVMRLADTHAL
ncbi:nicotinate phosphoribosyltransferase [Xenophilus arseniciresistens]|uniref:Nicotinamide phosphoribosyltransferase n=1 Tax=Xenophilus arseniciresistens TaxID=1283306 RepID=A0AAE3N9J2_9BURK|nr:nicotinate phosphoribosyltransferase [Xenophilus arseniciresistens]MDA7417646.1 nicotinate phosphoribosyltransferase [Xenophilus arseniciresistens]